MRNFVAKFAGIATLALATVPAAALTTSVHAETRVQVADLNLASAAGQAAYHQRVDKAARTFCGDEKALGGRTACMTGVRTEVNEKVAASTQYASRL